MKISIKSEEGSGFFSSSKGWVKAEGHRESLIPLLERALEVAKTGRWDMELREIVNTKDHKEQKPK